MQMIILNADQAVEFAIADTGRGAGLSPVALADGVRWILPACVLDDPAHAAVHEALSELPVENYIPPEQEQGV